MIPPPKSSASLMMDVVKERPALVILIVEDDPFLRMLAVEFVNEAGFETLEAGNADEAIAILESCSEIAVLFTDINMPGTMDGLKLALVVSNRWPAIAILIASGHVWLRQADLPPNGRFLGKPYRAEAMIAELHSLIKSRSTANAGVTSVRQSRAVSHFTHTSQRYQA